MTAELVTTVEVPSEVTGDLNRTAVAQGRDDNNGPNFRIATLSPVGPQGGEVLGVELDACRGDVVAQVID